MRRQNRFPTLCIDMYGVIVKDIVKIFMFFNLFIVCFLAASVGARVSAYYPATKVFWFSPDLCSKSKSPLKQNGERGVVSSTGTKGAE